MLKSKVGLKSCSGHSSDGRLDCIATQRTRIVPVEIELSSAQHCQNGKSMASKSPQLQSRTRAVMQTPISEKPSGTSELYLNTNDKK
ncbi:hypothetical protein QQF64_017907 [Cirrhinus molitorella]|uniref:Prolactin receptor n=1 Tax=Cirrhinus molitorella TaxID=172907 RepID=A0ABR3LNE1_9TELE